MSDWPVSRPMMPVISSLAPEAVGMDLTNFESSVAMTASATWPSANLGIYIPIAIPAPFLIKKVWWANGATVPAATSVDCGIVDLDGSLIATAGSTTQATVSVIQSVTLGTAVWLQPGSYLLAMSCSSASATFANYKPLQRHAQMYGIQQAASQVPLAASPTFAANTSPIVPLCGITYMGTI